MACVSDGTVETEDVAKTADLICPEGGVREDLEEVAHDEEIVLEVVTSLRAFRAASVYAFRRPSAFQLLIEHVYLHVCQLSLPFEEGRDKACDCHCRALSVRSLRR